MNVEIGAAAAQFPEKKYINGIAVAVYLPACSLPAFCLYIPFLSAVIWLKEWVWGRGGFRTDIASLTF